MQQALIDTAYVKDVPYVIEKSKRIFLLHPNVDPVASLFPNNSVCHPYFLFGSLANLKSEVREVFLNGEPRGKMPLLTLWYLYSATNRVFFGGLGGLGDLEDSAILGAKMARGIYLNWWPRSDPGLDDQLKELVVPTRKIYAYLDDYPRTYEGPRPLPADYMEFLSRDFPKTKWDPTLASRSKNIHWGQLKLHISEMEYLLAKGALHRQTLVIYPGGGPGLHVPLLATLFPLVKFILIDPVFSKPEIQPHPQIYWIASLFDIDLFEKLVHQVQRDDPMLQVLMFSDIRSTPGPEPIPVLRTDSDAERRKKEEYRKKYEAQFEDEAQKNMQMQLEWQRRLGVPSLFKFRLRFTPGQTKYPKGHLAFQVFAKHTSTELRLWSDDPDDLVTYDHTTIEQQLFHFNTKYRPGSFYKMEPHLGYNYDSAKTGAIFRKYIQEASLVKKMGRGVPVYGPPRTDQKAEDTLVVMMAQLHDQFFGRKFLVSFIEGEMPQGKKKPTSPMNPQDDYPYKKSFTPDQEYLNRFRRLQEYTLDWAFNPSEYKIINLGTTVKPFKMLYQGQPTIVRVFEDNYDKYDNFDFQEEQRVRCKRYDQKISSHEYWGLHKTLLTNEASNPKDQRELLYQRHYECTTFKPSLMVGFAKYFEATRILDISAGWGDRLIGAIAAGVEYFGTDPNTKLQTGYQEIIDFFGADPKKYQVVPSTFEEVKLPPKKFDLVLTSPPYFNLEQYGEVPVPSSLKAWLNDFLLFSLKKASEALAIGGHMLININDSKDIHYVNQMVNFNLPDMIYLGCISQASITKGYPKSPQPFWVWKKVELPKLDQLNPKVILTEYRSSKGEKYKVVRDDLLLGGTKQRIMKEFFQAHPEGVVYPGPETGYAQIALALGAKLSGSSVKILTREVRPPTKQSILASQLGADIIEYRGPKGNLKSLKESAIEVAKKEGMYLPKLGFEGDDFKEMMTKALDHSLTLDRKKAHKFWLVAGSGTLALTLYEAFPSSTFNIVQVGKKVDWLFKDLPRVNFHVAPEEFWEDAKDPPPYPSLLTYDAKVWQFAKKDLKGAIIWNVAGPVKEF